MKSLFDYYTIDLDRTLVPALDSFLGFVRPVLQICKVPCSYVLDVITHTLMNIQPEIALVFIVAISWQLAGARVAIGTALGLVLVGFLGAWADAMTTLGLVVTAVLFAISLGVPIGIVMAKVPIARNLIRPILDAMQTLPAFVYLIPIVIVFGIGNVAGVIVTIVYAMPPVVHLTCLGVTSIPQELRETADAFGASEALKLRRIELPLAVPSIMAGVNQTIMMALGMVVYSSMIAVKGLGLLVLRGIGSMDIGLAIVGGVGTVVLAMMLDRLSESAVGRRHRSTLSRGVRPYDLIRPAMREAKRLVVKQLGARGAT